MFWVPNKINKNYLSGSFDSLNAQFPH